MAFIFMAYYKTTDKRERIRTALVPITYVLMAVLCFLCAATAAAAEKSVASSTAKAVPHLKVTIDVVDGTGDDPMIVIWAESRKGFTKTLYWFSKDSEWYPDLTYWDGKRTKAGFKQWQDEPGIDAVMGPTIPWGGSKSCQIPIQQGDIDLLSGNYRLRIEQCKDKGGHFKKFKLPLPKNFNGGKLDKPIGYMKSLAIEVVK